MVAMGKRFLLLLFSQSLPVRSARIWYHKYLAAVFKTFLVWREKFLCTFGQLIKFRRKTFLFWQKCCPWDNVFYYSQNDQAVWKKSRPQETIAVVFKMFSCGLEKFVCTFGRLIGLRFHFNIVQKETSPRYLEFFPLRNIRNAYKYSQKCRSLAMFGNVSCFGFPKVVRRS